MQGESDRMETRGLVRGAAGGGWVSVDANRG